MNKPYWTVSEIRDHYRIPRRAMAMIIANGELVFHRFGTSKRVSDQDRLAWERRCRSVRPYRKAPTFTLDDEQVVTQDDVDFFLATARSKARCM